MESWNFADAEIPYRTHESPPLEPNQSQFNPLDSSLRLSMISAYRSYVKLQINSFKKL